VRNKIKNQFKILKKQGGWQGTFIEPQAQFPFRIPLPPPSFFLLPTKGEYHG